MNNRWTSRFLWTVGTLLLAGAVGLAWIATGPLEPESLSAVQQPSVAVASVPARSPAFVPLEQFSPIWQIDCRQPLDGSAPVASVPLSAAPPAINFRLVGTALDSEMPCAVFIDQQQHMIVCTIGQQVEGMRVTAIQPRSVIVEHQNQRFELKLPDPAAGGNGLSAPVPGTALTGMPMPGRLP